MMPSRRMLMPLAFAGGLLGWSSPASALCLLCSCSASVTPISFGTYSPVDTFNVDSSGSITVTCGLFAAIIASYTIDISPGASGSFNQRTMTQGASALRYNLYTSSARTQIWGDGTGGTGDVTGSIPLGLLFNVQNFSIYGRIPAGQNVPAGTYSDSIIVTVTY